MRAPSTAPSDRGRTVREGELRLEFQNSELPCPKVSLSPPPVPPGVARSGCAAVTAADPPPAGCCQLGGLAAGGGWPVVERARPVCGRPRGGAPPKQDPSQSGPAKQPTAASGDRQLTVPRAVVWAQRSAHRADGKTQRLGRPAGRWAGPKPRSRQATSSRPPELVVVGSPPPPRPGLSRTPSN